MKLKQLPTLITMALGISLTFTAHATHWLTPSQNFKVRTFSDYVCDGYFGYPSRCGRDPRDSNQSCYIGLVPNGLSQENYTLAFTWACSGNIAQHKIKETFAYYPRYKTCKTVNHSIICSYQSNKPLPKVFFLYEAKK